MNKCYLCASQQKSFLYKKLNFFIVKCLSCGFIYVENPPSKELLHKFYRKFDYRNHTHAEMVIRKDARRSLKRINKYLGKGSRLLDIGCGRGFFLDEARRMGHRVYGIDYSNNVVVYARKNLHLNVKKIDVFKFKTRQKFDIIVLNQVVEHLLNPNNLIVKCFELLKPRGLIYIATPNISSLIGKISKENFDHIIPPEHLGFFNKNTLSFLLKKHGFNPIFFGSWSYLADLAGIIKILLKKNHRVVLSGQIKNNSNSVPLVKQIKYILFDKIFCGIFYKILNFKNSGGIIEVLAIKK